jgi:hypothetical protein
MTEMGKAWIPQGYPLMMVKAYNTRGGKAVEPRISPVIGWEVTFDDDGEPGQCDPIAASDGNATPFDSFDNYKEKYLMTVCLPEDVPTAIADMKIDMDTWWT